MKKNLILFSIFISLIFTFDLINANLDFIQKINENKIKSEKIIIADKSLKSLESLKTRLDSLTSFKIIIQKKTDLIPMLIKEYGLKKYSNLIDETNYPNIMTVKISPKNLNNSKFLKLNKILATSKSQKIFHPDMVKKSLLKIEKINKFKPIVWISEWLLGILIIFTIQNLLEKNEDKFWDIFYSTGGQKKTRSTKFIFQNVSLIFVASIISIILENYIAKIYHLQISKFNVPSQIGMLFFPGLLVYLKNIRRGN